MLLLACTLSLALYVRRQRGHRELSANPRLKNANHLQMPTWRVAFGYRSIRSSPE